MTKLSLFVSKYKWLLILIILVAIVIIYSVFDPYKTAYFPKCPFYTFTGYKCPGCGSQRAIHNLLTMNFIEAVKENILLVIAIPYVAFGAFVDFKRLKNKKYQIINDKYYSGIAVWIIFTVIIVFWLTRNIFNF